MGDLQSLLSDAAECRVDMLCRELASMGVCSRIRPETEEERWARRLQAHAVWVDRLEQVERDRRGYDGDFDLVMPS